MKEKIPFDILPALLELDESKLNVFWFPPLLKLHSFQIREENTQKRNCTFDMQDSIMETLVLRLSQQVSGTKAKFETNLRKSIKF